MSYPYSTVSVTETLGFQLYLSARLLKARFRRALVDAGCELTPEQHAVLRKLWECEGVHLNELAQSIFKDRHNTTRIVKNLEKKGLVYKLPHEKDARLTRCFLTEEGKQLIPGLVDIATSHLSEVFKDIDEEDRVVMQRVLGQLVMTLENEVE
ncbi:MarR family winged helix-turn-helix transcriptional regulator [Pseudodesulfovibrio piezophilus]|uniref:Putative Transcriptional regulator, marR family n=1 Tax=Pseudodesulfovibrio piezophilus (strain DSM 21447 / JCM 15486 / C1TLV30) TaxID=1322246 RepID=M1WNE2_PSEP2|nr:MarR family transcriptional regulator [Pseudodesulfovibrio piezophilus]CCH50305.1 putative Transcriptional regulator, marR family [Pseudodesulfovibrio piezophilus C1TLV30]